MGCDIHAFIEVKVDGVWHLNVTLDVDRDYSFFNAIAGVRHHYEVDEPFTPLRPKGLPDDISEALKLYTRYWEADGHSYSWLDAKELETIAEWYERTLEKRGIVEFDKALEMINKFGYIFGNCSYNFIKYRADFPKWIEDIRYVFWFDN